MAPAAYVTAVRRLAKLDLDPATCRSGAERFAEERFLEELERHLEPQRASVRVPQLAEADGPRNRHLARA